MLTTTRKRSLGQSNIFTSVSYSFSPGGGGVSQHAMGQGDVCDQRGVTSRCDQGGLCHQGGVTRGVYVTTGCVTRGCVCVSRRVYTRPPPHQSTSGQYTFYWNTFLIFVKLTSKYNLKIKLKIGYSYLNHQM